MAERLQKLISAAGIASRRAAEALIAAGRVTVNGETASLGASADRERDTVCVDGVPLTPPERRVYLMLNKPRGYVTTLSDERGRPTAAELVADCGTRVYPVGRLDLDSEGLLLFTNDGAWMQRILHPSHEIEKTYEEHMTTYEGEQTAAFNTWFAGIKGKLNEDIAGSLQNQITEVDERLAALEHMTLKNLFTVPVAIDNTGTTLLADDLGNAIVADWKYKEE